MILRILIIITQLCLVKLNHTVKSSEIWHTYSIHNSEPGTNYVNVKMCVNADPRIPIEVNLKFRKKI